MHVNVSYRKILGRVFCYVRAVCMMTEKLLGVRSMKSEAFA